MGLGGHLLWTAAVRTLHEKSGRAVRVCYAPQVSDLLAGRLYRGDISLADDPIFRGNPRIEFPPLVAKGALALAVDRVTTAALQRLGLASAYERWIFGRVKRRATRHGQIDVHIDMALHSYAARELPDRMVWKTGGHIVDILLAPFGMRSADHRGEIYLSAEEERAAAAFCEEQGLVNGFVAIEPNSKPDWFGDLRAWPFERWQAVVDHLAEGGRCRIVQLGEGGGSQLNHALDLRGRLPIRLAIAVMKRARLFLGLEGGLMHAANAVQVPAVIVWGGLTLPEFAGYKSTQSVLCSYVECAPCGFRGQCPHGKKCLTSIPVTDVLRAIESLAPALVSATV